MTHPEHRRHDDAIDLKQARDACSELDAAFRHVRAFAIMMRDLRGDRRPGPPL
jgi:hypothetical protein